MTALAAAGQAIALFAATNIDDLVLLALLFGRARTPLERWSVVAGQYIGFLLILAVSVAATVATELLPSHLTAWLGLIPLTMGVLALVRLRQQATPEADETVEPVLAGGPSVLAVAMLTIAGGGDNIGIYVPVFSTSGTATLVGMIVTFLVLVGVWCAAALLLVTRRPVAEQLARWGDVLLPIALIGLGLVIMIEGGALT